MAPPPMTATRAGTSSMLSTWSELRIRSPSKSIPGRLRGLDPVASTSALVPVISVPSSNPEGAGGGVDQRAPAVERRDLAALEHRLQTLGQPVDHLLLALLRHRQIEDGLARLHAELLGAGHRAHDLGGLQQLLGRDAAPVQARAADPGLFDHPDRQPGGGAIERGGIPAGAPTEDDDIEFLRHETSSSNTLHSAA